MFCIVKIWTSFIFSSFNLFICFLALTLKMECYNFVLLLPNISASNLKTDSELMGAWLTDTGLLIEK